MYFLPKGLFVNDIKLVKPYILAFSGKNPWNVKVILGGGLALLLRFDDGQLKWVDSEGQDMIDSIPTVADIQVPLVVENTILKIGMFYPNLGVSEDQFHVTILRTHHLKHSWWLSNNQNKKHRTSKPIFGCFSRQYTKLTKYLKYILN